MKNQKPTRGLRALKCTAVLAGVLAAPTAAAQSTCPEAPPEPHGEIGDCGRTTRIARTSLHPDALAALCGLERTEVVCRAVCSRVESVRLAAATALARPLGSAVDALALEHLLRDPSTRVRHAARRAAAARGFDLPVAAFTLSDNQGVDES